MLTRRLAPEFRSRAHLRPSRVAGLGCGPRLLGWPGVVLSMMMMLIGRAGCCPWSSWMRRRATSTTGTRTGPQLDVDILTVV